MKEFITKLYSPFGETAEVDKEGGVTYRNIPTPLYRVEFEEFEDYEEAMRELKKRGWSLLPFDQR